MSYIAVKTAKFGGERFAVQGVSIMGRVGNLCLLASGAALAISSLASPAAASPQSELKDQAKERIAQLKAEGWPQRRCSIGTYLTNATVVHSSGQLQPGDKLLYLNNVSLEGKTDDAIMSVLKAAGPTAQIPARVDRSGTVSDLTLQCVDASTTQNALLQALDSASKKKVDECVAVLAPYSATDAQAAELRYQCAAVSGKAGQHDLAGMAEQTLVHSLAFTNYTKENRRRFVDSLRAKQGVLRPAAFERLVAQTKLWPGDETLFEDTTPNWNQFKANAEAAMLSSFFDPSSAIVEWPYGFTYGSWKPVLQSRIEGWWTCGKVNGKNRMGGYVGSRYFVVVLDQSGKAIFNQVGDGGDYDFVSLQCANSLGWLPPAATQFAAPPAVEKNSPGGSMADELAKLAQLKATGALTDEEYQAAKAKVLGGN